MLFVHLDLDLFLLPEVALSANCWPGIGSVYVVNMLDTDSFRRDCICSVNEVTQDERL